MSKRAVLLCLVALLASGCAYRQSTVLTRPETMEFARCDRIEGVPVGALSVALAAVLNSQYDQCIANAKNAGFLIPPTAGFDFKLDKSLQVAAVRGDASRAGLRVGDKLLKIDGFDMSVPSGRRGYWEYHYSKKPGDSITVLIQRGVNQMELTMKLPNF